MSSITGARAIFGAYDLYAKVLPGTVFFVGILTLLPTVPLAGFQEDSLTLITLSIVVTAVMGFMFGQALHSVAVTIEGWFYKLGSSVYHSTKYLKPDYWRSRNKIVNSYSSTTNGSALIKFMLIIITFIPRMLIKIYCRILPIIDGIFVPHRIWFKRKMRYQFEEKEQPELLYDWFRIRCQVHLRDFDLDFVDQYEDIYRFVMSYLEFVGSGRARQFQATSSLCRSMWITLSFYLIIYAAIVSNPTVAIPFSDSFIQQYLDEHAMLIFGILSTSVLVFMWSTFQYKKHFTEYIVVDFYTAINIGSLESTEIDE